MTPTEQLLRSAGHLACPRRRPAIMRWPPVVCATIVLCIGASARSVTAQVPKDNLAVNIDSSASPRDDFFQFANGAWFKRNPIPDDQARWSPAHLGELFTRLRRVSEAAATEHAPKGSPAQLIGDFWFTGMDSATINRQGLSVLRPELDRIDRIRSIGDIIDVVAMLHRRDMLLDGPVGLVGPRTLFSARVTPDEGNSSRRILILSQGGNTVGALVYRVATDPRRVTIRNAFREYLVSTFLRLGRDSSHASADANAVFELEENLANATGRHAGRPMLALAELRHLTPTIDWDRYFREIHLVAPDSVSVPTPQFLQALDSLLRVTPLETWRAYLQFCLVRAHAPFLDDATFGDFFTFDRSRTGTLRPRPRWMRVVWEEKYWLGQALAQLILNQEHSRAEEARTRAMGEDIRRAFASRITQLGWMSESTRYNALQKLAAVRITISWPEQWLDVSSMPIRRDSYALNMARSAEWFHDWEMKQFAVPISAAEIDPHFEVGGDAGYDDHANEVAMQSVPGSSSAEVEDAIRYGSTALGHEISHAFDSVGRHYDSHGNRVDWWTAADTLEFNARAQVLIDEYSAFMPIEGARINGRSSLRENMADLVGLRVQLDAFMKTEQYKRKVRIAGFTPLQRFFLAYAQSRMVAERPEYIRSLLNSSYAPARERVNGALMNVPEFYEAFGVRPGDRMYLTESARAKIW